MQQTLIILKPSAVQRSLIGEIIARFERKGLQIIAIKMVTLSDSVLEEHYNHLIDKPFFKRVKESMQVSPVVLMVLKGVDAIAVVRKMVGVTNGREALPGTIRGDFSMSIQENIVHASDSQENADIEIQRFFNDDEIFNYFRYLEPTINANTED